MDHSRLESPTYAGRLAATRTREIPREQWRSFFEGFSRRHWNWLATVEVLGDRIGAQIEVRELPLPAVFFEARDDSITLVMGKDSEKHLEHPVPAPRRVWLEEGEGGAEAALEIESESGTKTILEFRSVVVPEAVDGLVP
jgi:hypothetical protein